MTANMDDSNRLAKSIVSAATSGPVIGALRNATAQGGMAVRDDHHSGQVRMAYRLAKQCDGKLLHVHGIGWHYWDGTIRSGYAQVVLGTGILDVRQVGTEETNF